MTAPRASYAARLAAWGDALARGERQHGHLANLRLLDAALFIAVAWLAYTRGISWWWLGLPGVAFAALVGLHARVARDIGRATRARLLYERGLSRLEGTWKGAGPDGGRFAAGHAVAADLDLFGPGSLFQLLTTARTEVGEETLAAWLTEPAELVEAQARQAAVAELRTLEDFREALAISAADVAVGRTNHLLRWASSGPRTASPVLRASLWLVTAISAGAAAALAAGWVTFAVLGLWALVPAGVGFVMARRAGAEAASLDRAATDLALLRSLLELVEAQHFGSPGLMARVRRLMGDGQAASAAIAALERRVTWLDSCRNQFFLPVAILFVVPSLVSVAIEDWRAQYGSRVADWFAVVGELEALSALATYAFEHPADPFPQLDADGPRFEATGLGHPLIHDAVAVRNDVALGGGGPHVLMVSGSNMSGKSTLLRTVGVNVVLALAGAPVRATRARLSRLALGTALHVEDSLKDGHSRFYAEILRLRAIVELGRGPVPLLFLLDEILAGTNSHDRRIGAEAVIQSLAQAGAIGLVTTHDLALTTFVTSLGVPASNVHFEDTLEDGRMRFDYRMRPGVVEHSNALALMRAIGLDV